MKRSILIVDWLLIIIFLAMLLSKFIELGFYKYLQPLFFILILIHIIQHWKIIVISFKNLIKK